MAVVYRTLRLGVFVILAGALCGTVETGAQCVGDCDGNDAVEINNLILGVSIALGAQPLTACTAFDCQGDGTVPIHCLVQAVSNALSGCLAAPTATATGTGPTATNPVAPATPTATPAPPMATATARPTMTSAAAGPACAIATADCGASACSCGTFPGTDYHIGATGSVSGPVGTELRININAPQGGVLDCGGWTRIFGATVTGCDIIGCCRREAGDPDTAQWSVFEVIDLPCMCPAAPAPDLLRHNFLIQCQRRPGPVMEVEQTSTGCP